MAREHIYQWTSSLLVQTKVYVDKFWIKVNMNNIPDQMESA